MDENKKPLIVTISGKARNGKDTISKMLKELMKDKKKSIVFHYADAVKMCAERYYNWDGQKDIKGRTLLQKVGTEFGREKNQNVWVEIAMLLFETVLSDFDVIFIPDCRFPNEIELIRSCGYDVISIKVIRDNFDNGLTDEQKNHISETALDDYIFDFTVHASNLYELEQQAKILSDSISKMG